MKGKIQKRQQEQNENGKICFRPTLLLRNLLHLCIILFLSVVLVPFVFVLVLLVAAVVVAVVIVAVVVVRLLYHILLLISLRILSLILLCLGITDHFATKAVARKFHNMTQ